MTVCISDFGFARDVGDELYYRIKTKNRKVPLWTAPEVTKDQKYTVQSDVVRFILLKYYKTALI